MAGALTISERERVRYHLGYMQVQPAGAIQFGVVIPKQTLFLLELNMSNLLPEATDRVRALISALDNIECQMLAAIPDLRAIKVGELELRPDNTPGQSATDLMEREYVRWAGRLADVLGVPYYPFSERFAGKRASTGNIPVG